VTVVGRDIRRILVIRRKGLGDALVTLPAVRRLAEAFPRAHVDLVIDRPFAQLLGDLARGLTVVPWSADIPGWRWVQQLRARRYDLVLDYLGSPRTAVWTALSGAPVRVGYDLCTRRWAYNVRVPRNRSGQHRLNQFAGEAFLDPLRALGLAPDPWRGGGAASLDPSLGEAYRDWHQAQAATGRPRVVLVFSASWPAKAWPAVRAAACYRELAAAGLDPVLAPGPGDDDLIAGITAVAGEVRMAPPTSLPELAHLLTGSAVFVGTDNGARHLAAALGVPTVTVFGPTDPRGWNPDDPRHVAVVRPVPCAPCNLTRCPVPGHPCLDDLPAADVTAAVLALLGWPVSAAETGKEST
jgi:ADP-heptose:LPS heptosyltransferase